jgi:GNAT superfamily N-acetyltransferase
MVIEKFDPSADMDAVRVLLNENDELWQAFLYTTGQWNEGAYLAREGRELVGVLSLRKYMGRIALLFLFVGENHRRKGMGTKLLSLADRLLSDSIYEQALFRFPANEETARFMRRGGFYHYCGTYEMEREPTLLDYANLNESALHDSGIMIRNYADEDYIAWHNVSDLAFYLLRNQVGLTPQYYQPPSESERKKLAGDSRNRYVLVVDGIIAAVGALSENTIRLLAVRTDLQARGYGRMLASWFNNKIILEQQPEKVKIDVIFGNPAKKLYERLGFHDVRITYEFVKFYKPDSRAKAPKGYTGEEEILRDLRLYGGLLEEMEP